MLKIPFSFRFFTLEKEAACSALNKSLPFGNAHLLTCDVECCDGDNCNHPNFTGKYPMTWARRLTSNAYGNVSLYNIRLQNYWIDINKDLPKLVITSLLWRTSRGIESILVRKELHIKKTQSIKYEIMWGAIGKCS